MRGLVIGRFIPGDSAVHRLDPRTKILAAVAFVAALFVARTASGYLVLAAFAAGAVGASGVDPRVPLRGLRAVTLILGLTFALNLFMFEGTPLFRVGPLIATVEGASRGALLSARLALLVVTTSVLTLTTSPVDLTDGLERLLGPFARLGLPAHELAMMMAIALRFIPTLLEEADKIMKAQMARGADFGGRNPVRRARSLVPLLVPLFVSAFRRADELALAMEARCYRGGKGRTRMKLLSLGPLDAVAGGAVAALVAATVATRYAPF